MSATEASQVNGSSRIAPAGSGEGSPKRWKTWAVSLIGLYPLVLGFLAFVAPHVARWPLPAKAALFPLVLLTAMTYLVMPTLTRVMRRWL